MEELSQEYILSYVFKESIDREQLLLKKYDEYYETTRDKELKGVIRELREQSEEHVNLLKDKMIKLKIIG